MNVQRPTTSSRFNTSLNRSPSWIKKALPVSLCLVLTSCAVSPEYDKQVGYESAQAVSQQMGIYNDQDLSLYIQQVGARLVSELDDKTFQFQFEIIDDPMPNAFALPGGYVYITRGLLSLMDSEDELACVLAHEIIHVTERHSIQQMKNSVLPGIATIPGNIVGVVSQDLGNVINAPINTGSSLLLAGYSRGHETESDTLGIQLAAKAGYQPLAMNDILQRMNTAIELVTKQESEKSYFDSHPFTPDRVDSVIKTSSNITVIKQPPIESNFVAQLDGLVIGSNPRKGLFQDSLFLQPDMNIALSFPENWNTINLATMAGAVNQDQTAFVLVRLASNEFTAKEYAQRYQAEIHRRYQLELEVKERSTADNTIAYSVTATDDTSKPAMEVTQLWLNHGQDTYQIVFTSPQDLVSITEQSALSFRGITAKEMASITYKSIELKPAKNGESLAAFKQRTKTDMSLEMLAMLNNLQETSTLKQSKPMKVVVEKGYAGSMLSAF